MPAAQMSAPESGKMCTVASPFKVSMWIGMVGAGSVPDVVMMRERRILGAPRSFDERRKRAFAFGPVFL